MSKIKLYYVIYEFMINKNMDLCMANWKTK